MLDDLPALKDHNFIDFFDRAQMMSDNDTCSPLEQFLHRSIDASFRCRIEPRGGFIENNETGIL